MNIHPNEMAANLAQATNGEHFEQFWPILLGALLIGLERSRPNINGSRAIKHYQPTKFALYPLTQWLKIRRISIFGCRMRYCPKAYEC